MNKRFIEVTVNILFWILTAWLLTSVFSIEVKEVDIINGVETVKVQYNTAIIEHLLLVLVIAMFMFYATFYIVLNLKKDHSKLKIAIWSFIVFTFAAAIVFVYSQSPFFTNLPSLPLNLTLGILLFYYSVSITYGLGKVWVYIDKLRQNLLLKKKQAELSLLRSQLHPHFLFNTLNNLLAMVNQQQNPNLASALNKLSGLLRYVVYDIALGKVPVIKEIDFIRNFCDLQALRFEKEEVHIELEINGEFDHQLIEPGIFIPFIENAFKYGTEPEKKARIKIIFNLSQNSKITFSVCNQIYSSIHKTKGAEGNGIHSTTERLKLVYPQKHSLIITKDRDFKVELDIQTS